MKVGDLIKRKTPENGWMPNPDIFGEDYYTVFGVVTLLADDYCFAAFVAGVSPGKIVKIRSDRVELINESR